MTNQTQAGFLVSMSSLLMVDDGSSWAYWHKSSKPAWHHIVFCLRESSDQSDLGIKSNLQILFIELLWMTRAQHWQGHIVNQSKRRIINFLQHVETKRRHWGSTVLCWWDHWHDGWAQFLMDQMSNDCTIVRHLIFYSIFVHFGPHFDTPLSRLVPPWERACCYNLQIFNNFRIFTFKYFCNWPFAL